MLVEPVSDDLAREQVDRILRSEGLRNAEGLRRLFAYLAEKSLTGAATQLKEYCVGVDVFGKPEDYDPQRDPSVRIQAGKLRQKLEEYYLKEGQNDPVFIEFPKGHFQLQFHRRTREAPAAAPRWKWKTVALVLAAGWAITLGAFLLPRTFGPGPLTPEQRAVWSPLLDEDQPLVLCLGTPLFIKTERGFFRSPQINRWEEADESAPLDWLKADLASGKAMGVHIYTGFGDALAALEIARLVSAAGGSFVVRRSAALNWDELVNANIVFLGPPKYTPRINEIPVQMDFVMDRREIRNLRPKPGEPASFQGSWPNDSPYVTEDYALISRIPGLHGRGRYLILSASSTEGTAAAALYVTDPKFVSELVGRVSGGSGKLPEFFQAVVHARFRAMVPVEIRYRLHRELHLTPAAGKDSPAAESR
jgi:hypothetical protein